MITRQQALQRWLSTLLQSDVYEYKALTGDASFRRYYRLFFQQQRRIVMDAPPKLESLEAFISIAAILKNTGLNTPTIYAINRELGFLLLEDFGDELLLNALNIDTADYWYKTALHQLLVMQKCTEPLAFFDSKHIMQELHLFSDWFLQQYLQLDLSHAEQTIIEQTFTYLTTEILKQPQVFIHRDFHARNIMINSNNNKTLAIIDFQDAMMGPITYDLVSLLKDCYIHWPRGKVLSWVHYFYQHSPIAQQWSAQAFLRAFDFCGLQRHLKVLGIFARLHLRDNKSNYLNDLPLTLQYVKECLMLYPELASFNQIVQRIQLP